MSRVLRIATGGIALVAGCGDLPPSPSLQPLFRSTAPAISSADDRLQQRLRIRNMADSVLVRRVQEHGNIVVVGIKPEQELLGVGSRGENLVPPGELRARYYAVRALASRVLHEFRSIPAIAVQLREANSVVALRRMPWVDYVIANSRDMTPDALVDNCVNPLSNAQTIGWAVARINADDAWATATGTNGALLILDDGLDVSLAQNPDTELPWWAYYSFQGQTSSSDDGSHGTLTFSVAGARNNSIGIVGSAPAAEMHYGDILPGGFNLQWQNAAALIIDTTAPNTRVVSISYSSKETSEPPGFAALHDAIISAYYQRSILFVASTGNQGNASWVAYPAAYDEVIGVGGSNSADEYALNNYGGASVEVAAPAVDVPVVCKGAGTTGVESGTSFATPLVAGGMMLMRQHFPTHSNDQLRTHLRETAVPMAEPQKSGAGRVDILAALAPIVTSPPGPPSVSIVGNTEIQALLSCQWAAVVRNGTAPFTYSWTVNGLPAGDGSESLWYENDGNPFTIAVTVTDSDGRITSDGHEVAIASGMGCA
mgnify:CR=1 FL=1